MRSVHYKKEPFLPCEPALVTQELDGGAVNLQVVPNGPEQLQWRPRCEHGLGRGNWHPIEDCEKLHAKDQEDKAKAEEARLAALKAAE